MKESEAKRVIEKAMEESEIAIEKLKAIKSDIERTEMVGEYYSVLDNCIKEQEACVVAIQALEEVQQYRAIGTVEGYERAIQISIENYSLCKEYKAKVQEFEAIGTVEEFKAIKQWKSDIIESFGKYDVNSVDELMKRFRELTEKAEPKKPKRLPLKEGIITTNFECPVCGCRRLGHGLYLDKCYCPECGQKLDWYE